MGKNREIKTRGIILRRIPFKETSFILEMLSEDFGKISVIAKGIRKEKNANYGIIDILNELEVVLYKNPSSEWYIFKSGTLVKAYLYETEFTKSLYMQAAAEFLLQIIIPEEDAHKLFRLIKDYFDFLGKVIGNEAIVFWRFLLRALVILGIEINMRNCVICEKRENFPVAYFPQKSGFICENCFRPHLKEEVIELDKKVSKIIRNIYNSNKLLNDLLLSAETVSQINSIFLIHLSEHFHKKFHFKTLALIK
ncbi:MAG: DNA repair protein RecO [Candidatus Cloacimonas sp. 4484_275]|nr:MAG: DNA repair protein RecO [Candidatus Cloacimonas sp. 4484_275]